MEQDGRRAVKIKIASWVLLLAVFSGTLLWCVQGWMHPSGYFEHGPLLLLVAGYFFFRRRNEWKAVPAIPSRLGAAFLALILLFHLAAAALQVDSFSGFLLVPALFALLLAQEGKQRLKIAAPSLGLLMLAIPFPVFITGRLAYGLKHFATKASVLLGKLFGLGLVQDGATIHIPGQTDVLLVGDACSGLKSLVALFALGYIFAFLLGRRTLGWRLFFLIASLGTALLANFVRLTVLAWIAKGYGVAYASGPAHDISGTFLYLGAIAFLVLLDYWIPSQKKTKSNPSSGLNGPEAAELPTQIASTPPSKNLWFSLLLPLVLLGVPAGVLSWVKAKEPQLRLASRMPDRLGVFQKVQDYPLSERWYALLGTRDVCWRRYRDLRSGMELILTLVFHGNNWKSVHPPQTCLEASGFDLQKEGLRQLDNKGREVSFVEAKKKGESYLVAYLFGGQDFETGSYLSFFLHNSPKALFRQPVRGYLLRADLPVVPEMDRKKAEQLLADFLRTALPIVNSLIKDEG
jgi:exosortase